MEARFVCEDCGSINIAELDDEDEEAQWLLDLRLIPGWDVRGRGFEHLFHRNGWLDNFDEEELERAVESFASTQARTLKGYTNMVMAFKNHIAQGYHKPKSERTAAPKSGGMLRKDGRY